MFDNRVLLELPFCNYLVDAEVAVPESDHDIVRAYRYGLDLGHVRTPSDGFL